MKRIEAIIRPHKLDEVLKALDQLGVSGVTVVETIGFGRQRGHSEVFRGSEESFGLVPKRMLVLYTADEDVDELVRCICSVAQTGKVGDGKLVVCDVTRVVRIRTGENTESVVAKEDGDGI